MSHQRARSAVVFSITYLGDLVLATLTFDALKARFRAPIEVVTSATPAPLLAADTRVRAVRVVASSHPIGWRVAVLREFLRARRHGWAVVNLEMFAPRWRLLRALCRVTATHSLHLDLPALRRDEAAALDGKPCAQPHRSFHYARTVGVTNEEPALPRLVVPQEARATIAARLSDLGREPPARIVIIHPGSSSLARRAPLPLLAETLRSLASQHPTLAIGVGSGDERHLVGSLGERMAPTRFTSWAGELNVVELAALLEQAHLFIGNDSGPLKMAEAIGARTLSFWGASSPKFAGPRGAGHRMLGFTHSANEAVEIALELLGRS